MMDNLEHIDNIFNEGLDNLQVAPPSAAWDNIAPLVKKKRRTPIILIQSVAAAAVITLGIFIFTNKNQDTTNVQSMAETHQNELNNSPANIKQRTKVSTSKPSHIQPKAPTPVPLQNTTNLSATTAAEALIIDSTERIDNKLEFIESMGSPVLANNERHLLFKENKPAINEQAIINYNLQFSSTYKNDELNASKDKMSFSIAGQASPILASVEKPTPVNANIINNIQPEKSNSEELVAFSAGFSVSLNSPGRFSVRTGIMYTQMGTVSQESQIYALGDVLTEFASSANSDNIVSSNNNTSYNAYIPAANKSRGDELQHAPNIAASIITEETNSLELVENMEYIEVPVTMSYKFIDRKVDFNISGGVATNFLVGTTVITSINNDRSNNVLDISDEVDKVKFATNIGLGMEYPLMKKFTLLVEPTLKYYIQSNPELQTSQIKPFAFGIYTGINYRF